MKQAQQAGLSNRPTWKAYPQRMLQHRARGNAIRDAFPDVIHGLISAEEAQDYDEPKDITPPQEAVAAPTLEALTEPKVEEVEVVQEPTESIFDQYLENVVPKQREPIVAESFTLCVPNKQPTIYQDPLHYMDAYNDLLLAVRRASTITPAVRRTKMKELEQENVETFKLLPEDMVKELKEKRIAYNASLGIEEKENG